MTELEKLKISNFQAGILREIGVGGEVVESSTPHFLNGASSIVIVKIFNRLSSQTVRHLLFLEPIMINVL